MEPPSTNKKLLHIAAIETSCDETAIAIIEALYSGHSFRVLSNIVLSQVAMHAQWGGVVPNLAKREHEKNLPFLLLKSVQESNFSISKSQFSISKFRFHRESSAKPGQIPNSKTQILNSILEKNEELQNQFEKHLLHMPRPNIDLIAVTQGPGLEPALWVGVNFARALSMLWDIPLIGINHMEGHIASALLKQSGKISNFQFPISKKNKKISNYKRYMLKAIRYPALALLVSGGHTELVLIKKPLQYKIIGETRDDAAGEAFDKVARILGLSYPGGPQVSAEAQQSEVRLPKVVGSRTSDCLSLPRPMIHSKDFDFSFSGLKTAVLYMVRDLEKQGANIKKLRPAICKEFENAVVDVLVSKTIRAAKQYKIKTILLGGGVAANVSLQKNLAVAIKKDLPNSKFYMPNSNLTGDNALMIATAAIGRAKHAKKTAWKTLKPDANMRF